MQEWVIEDWGRLRVENVVSAACCCTCPRNGNAFCCVLQLRVVADSAYRLL
jgi:hypothetical protein